MLKKNQLALILLTLVMMLTVYYIKTPSKSNNDENLDPAAAIPTGRLEQLSSRRVVVKNSRKEVIAELDAVIASTSATLEEKANSLDQKERLNELTEKELLLELDIINKGYQDSFVHATSDAINIVVVADTHSVSVANEIILMALVEFEGISNNVSVEFLTVSEVMGTVSE